MNRTGYIAIFLWCMTAHQLWAQPDYSVEPLSLNHSYSNAIYAFPVKDGLIYSSDLRTHVLINRVDSTHQPLFHLFYAPMKDSAKLGMSHLLSKNLPINAHQGPFSVSANGNEMYFSLNDAHGQRIFSATQSGDQWGNIRPFAHNRPNYTVTHPSLSHDGKRLFFASDMPGGFGGFDIYVCEKTPSGWGQPKNLGATVNTSENELYPFIQENGEMYFSSTAHGSMGGLDIFSVREINGEWGTPFHLGEPVNSAADDISYTAADADGTSGYFASNRSGKTFDLYSFKSLFPTFNDCQEQEENDYTLGWRERTALGMDTTTLKLRWEFSDGTVMYGEEVWHTFASTGQYEVYLSVVDTLTGEITKQVAHRVFDVLDVEQPFIAVEETVVAGTLVPFNASKTYLPDLLIDEYFWMFGDGTRKKGVSTEHTYTTTGVYRVQLGVIGRSKHTGAKEKICVFREITVQ